MLSSSKTLADCHLYEYQAFLPQLDCQVAYFCRKTNKLMMLRKIDCIMIRVDDVGGAAESISSMVNHF